MTRRDEALALHRAGRFTDAEALYRAILADNPGDGETLGRLGALELQTGRGVAAHRTLSHALALRPGDAGVQHNLGEALRALGDPVAAISAFRLARYLSPDNLDSLVGEGAALADAGDLDAAVARLTEALDRQPAHPMATGNLALALLQQGQVAASAPLFDAAVAADPTNPLLVWNRALTRLVLADYARGLPGLEARWSVPGFPSPMRTIAAPRWRGEALDGRRILLHGEQGMGDCIQFVRYVPLVAAQGGRVTLALPGPLLRLYAESAGADAVVDVDDPLPPTDCHCPLMSLPELFATRVETIPPPVPPRVDPTGVLKWRRRLEGLTGRRVGLVWRGNRAFRSDRTRSLTPETLAPLADLSGIAWVSLQKEGGPPFGMKDIANDLIDFADTAAVMAALDLVITVDTAAAHLAGSLGVPVWLMLPHPPDWRWLLDREDSPWYPAARLFRQATPGAWPSVIAAVASALRGA